MSDSMTVRERYIAYISGKPVDRAPVVEQAPWWGVTVERWRNEGLPAELDAIGITEYFGLDKWLGRWTHPFTAETPRAKGEGLGVMEDEEDYEKILPTLFTPPEKVIPEDHAQMMKMTQKGEASVHCFNIPGSFWYPRNLFGIENHLFSFYDYPDLYKRVCEDYADWLERVFDYVFNKYHFDYVCFSEDMSYNGGAMISKDLFDEFIAPFYKRLVPIVHGYGKPVSIDSDGDITEAVDWYGSVGADIMSPLERQAGVDVSVYIDKQPKMAFVGHFNKMCMKNGEEAMREEFERLLPSMNRGKLIPAVDHQTPPDVSLENYRIYVSLLKEYAGKIDCSRKGILPCRVFGGGENK